jgi:hypothetical protein
MALGLGSSGNYGSYMATGRDVEVGGMTASLC